MNFNVYLDDDTTRALDAAARREGRARNALIREAVSDWLERHSASRWPASVLSHRGMPSAPRFEALRAELPAPADDPFARR